MRRTSLFRDAIGFRTIHALRDAGEALRTERSFSGGLRRLIELSRPVSAFVSSRELQPLLDAIGLPDAFLVRSILFDKTPESNWKILLHASSPSTQATHRRVIHLEFANEPLPAPLKWA